MKIKNKKVFLKLKAIKHIYIHPTKSNKLIFGLKM
jgi:hypothetical protein